MANRINKAIELREQDQPIYYVGSHSGADLSYEAGQRQAKTYADYINIGMEPGSFDMPGLDQFLRGLVDGGPTNSGHRTPAVIVELPVDGGREEIVRTNAWQIRQILARGVHGLLLCHAETPGLSKPLSSPAAFLSRPAGWATNSAWAAGAPVARRQLPKSGASRATSISRRPTRGHSTHTVSSCWASRSKTDER